MTQPFRAIAALIFSFSAMTSNAAAAPEPPDFAAMVEELHAHASDEPTEALAQLNELLAPDRASELPAPTLARAYAAQAIALMRTGEIDDALQAGQTSLEIVETRGLSESARADAMDAIGAAYLYLGEIALSLEHHQSALRIRRQQNDDMGLARSYMDIASLYLSTGQPAIAEENYRRANEHIEKSGSPFQLLRLQNNLAWSVLLQSRYEEAVAILEPAYALALELDNDLAAAYLLENLGEAYYYQGDYQRARGILVDSLKQAEELDLDTLQSGTLIFLAEIEFEMGDLSAAEANARSALRIATDVGEPERLSRSYDVLAKTTHAQGRHRLAYDYLEKSFAYKQQIGSEEVKKALALNEKQFELEQHEIELALLRKESELQALRINRGRILRNGLLVGVLVCGLLSIVLFTALQSKTRANARARKKTAELLRVQAQLTRANKAKSEFLAMTSHEIRTPLNGVLGMAQLLNVTPLNAEQKFYVETIKSSGDVLLTILSDILDLSKIEAGRLEISRHPFSVGAIKTSVENLWRAKAQEKGLDFRVVSEGDMAAPLLGDQNRIRQIVFNLISNAIKFTEEGEVCVTIAVSPSSPDAQLLRLEVRDTGIGISAEKQADVFRPFIQADAGPTRSFGGTGLGLAICRELAGLMNGEIGLESQPGSGSRFWAEIPLAIVEDAPQIAPEPLQAVDAAVCAGLRLLVAEDNPLNRDVISDMLRRAGCTVDLATDGFEAVSMSEQEAYDAILMDIHMPRMNGLDAMEAIRAHGGRSSDAPIIALTADAMSGDRERYLAKGMCGYVVKPVDAQQLISQVMRCAPGQACNSDPAPQSQPLAS